MKNKLNERIIPISNEGNQFFIYFTGNTIGDESPKGEPIEKEELVYLDDNLNKFVCNINKDWAGKYASDARKMGINAFVGPHSPEIETVDGKYVPNKDSNCVGIWEKATKDELIKYHKILEKQNKERFYTRLYK